MRSINVLLILTILAFVSCNSDGFEEHQIGSNLIDKTTEVVLVDSLKIESSTIILDSLVTSGLNTVILGSYNDEYLGKVKTEYYGLIGLNGAFLRSTVTINNTTIKVPIQYDSLVFMAYTNGSYFGDTLKPQRLILNRINEDLELPDNETAFYAHSKFGYDETPLLDTEFYLKPVKQSKYDATLDADPIEYHGEGLFIRMNSETANELGSEIVDFVNNQSDTVVESIQWEKYMKGIVFRSGDDNSTLFQVPLSDNKLKIRLYYSDTDYEGKGVAKFHDFPVIIGGSQQKMSFLNYSSDRTLTPQQLDRLVKQDVELSSEETDDLVYLQGGIGFYTKFKIPYLENLNTLGIAGGIIKAELVMYPTDNSYDDEIFTLPKFPINIYTTNRNNEIGAPLVGNSNSALSFSFVRNYNNKDESYYSADLTNYVNSVLLNGKEYDDALLIGFPRESIGGNFDRLIIENDPDSDFRMRLKVTYVIQR